MTTIAYRDGIMAADSMLSDYHDIKRGTKKIFVLDDAVVGTAGDDDAITRFLEWWREGHDLSKRPKRVGDCHILIVPSKGRPEIWDESYTGEPVAESFCAIGSGRAIAYGALEMGASAKEAVQAACKWNVHTRGPVKVIDVYKTLGIKRRKK